ncbi:MAG TPA: ATP-binding protein [Gemmatimonadales bacterium]|nr:ATP-binding protein [Gemmatimonadales bacterium]
MNGDPPLVKRIEEPSARTGWRGPWTLRRQLLGLTLAVALPFVGLLSYVAYRSVAADARRAQTTALDVARASAFAVAAALRDAAVMATSLADRAARVGVRDCDRLRLGEVVSLGVEFSNVSIADHTGRITCSGAAVRAGTVNVADRAWFRDALAADTAVYDGPIQGRISRQWTVAAAMAIRTPDGRSHGAVGVSIDLNRLHSSVAAAQMAPTWVTAVFNRSGKLIVRTRDPELWVGREVQGVAIVDTALARQEGGNATGRDVDGVDRLWGIAIVPQTRWRVIAGLETSAALAPARTTLRWALAFGGLFTIVVLGLAFAIAGRIARPIHALVEATAAAERGDFRQIDQRGGPAEVRRLGARFNAMVAARAAAEVSLRASEARFQKAFGASPTPMAISAWPSGIVIDVNDSYVATFGWSREEIIGRSAVEIGLWRDLQDRDAMRDDLEALRPVRNREYQFRKKSGETIVGLYSADRIEVGGQPCVISLFVDVTERRRLELQLRQAQKMEAIGQLTGGIAHDFNNLLTAVLGNAELIAADLPADRQDLRAELDDIRAAARRGAGMVKKLLAFARKERLETAPVDLAEVVREVSAMLRHLVPETIRIDTMGVQPGVWVPADRGALEQILINLVTNARDAMPQGGDLLIATRHGVIDDAFWMEHGWGEPGEYGLLSVRDTGVGMDEETRAHLFEPFFTTKPRGQGTGLGMAMVYGLVKQQGGFVSVESQLGQGTTVTIFLPASDRPAAQPPAPEVKGPPGGRETILLVEDEPLIREAGRRALARQGYEVLTAADGEEALQILRREPGRVALVVTDIVMPRRTGPELFQAVSGQPEAPRFLFTSGYAEYAGGPGGGVPPGAELLAKPWSLGDLVSRVRFVLDR